MAQRPLEAVFTGDTRDIDKAFGRVQAQAQGFSAGMKSIGQGLTKTLTPVAAGLALLGRQAFQEWDTGFDTIRANTGATGDELEELGGVMRRVGGQVTQPLSEIGTTIAELNKRLGLTGDPLERMTKQFADLQRLGMEASVREVARVFTDWSVATEDQADELDGLFRAAQATGATIDQIAAGVVRFGAPLRQFGFSLEQAAALVGKFEQEGVNANLVMGSLRIALGRMAKAGRDPVAGLQATIQAIRDAGGAGEANAIALEVFGARAGPDMAAAIREGRFEIDALFTELQGGGDTIAKAAADTLDLSDKFLLLRNRIFATLGPFGEMIAIGAGVAAGIGPLVLALGLMGPALANVRKGFLLLNAALLTNPFVLIAAALVALGVALVVAYKKSETFRDVVNAVFEAVKRVVIGVISTVLTLVDKYLGALQAMAEAASHLPFVGDQFRGVADAIGSARENVRGLRDDLESLGESTRTTTSDMQTLREEVLDLHAARATAAAEPVPTPTMPEPPAGATAQQRNQWFDAAINRRLSRVQDIATVRGQVDELRAIGRAIEERMAATEDTTRRLTLEDQLLDIERQIRQKQAAQTQAAIEAQKSALAKAKELTELERERAKKARERAAEARAAAQFRALGFGPTGGELIPTVRALRARLGSIRDTLKGTVLDTSAARKQLEAIRRVLSGKLGEVNADIRRRIDEMLDALKPAGEAFDGFNLAAADKLARFRERALASTYGRNMQDPAIAAATAGATYVYSPTIVSRDVREGEKEAQRDFFRYRQMMR